MSYISNGLLMLFNDADFDSNIYGGDDSTAQYNIIRYILSYGHITLFIELEKCEIKIVEVSM